VAEVGSRAGGAEAGDHPMNNLPWVYPEGHEPDWLDLSGDDLMADMFNRDPELRIMELEAEVRNKAVEVWWLRGLVALIGSFALTVTYLVFA
jgi:hypothetical protein